MLSRIRAVVLLFILLQFIFSSAMCFEENIEDSLRWGELFPVDNCTLVEELCRDPNEIKSRSCDTICLNGHCKVTVGVILPNYPDTYPFIVNLNRARKQLEAAESEAKKRGLLNNITIAYEEFDDRCRTEHAMLAILDGYTERCVNVIFGPICDYALATTRITKFVGSYGTPVISTGGFVFDFSKKKTDCSDEFFMVFNSGSVDYRSFSEFFHYYMIEYDWKALALMYEKYDQNEVAGEMSCQLLLATVLEDVKLINGTSYFDGDIVMQKVTYEEYLQRMVGVQYGIITLCASWQNVRKIMLVAERMNMMDRGEYIFFTFDMYNNATIPMQPWYDPSDTSENNERARKAYRNLFIMTPLIEAQKAEQNTTLGAMRGQVYLDDVYNGMLLLSHALNDTITNKENFTLRGIDLANNIFGRKYAGKYENITINCNGRRTSKYAMMQMHPSGEKFHIVSEYDNLDKSVTKKHDIIWLAGSVPPDSPTCGYDNSKCPNKLNVTLIIVGISTGIFLIIVSIFLYRRYKLEADIASMTWKVDYDKIRFIDNTTKLKRLNSGSNMNLKRCSQATVHSDMDGYSLPGDRQLYTRIGYYKSIRVAAKQIDHTTKIVLTRAELLELKVLKDLSNDHLTKFHGACIDEYFCCILTEYCPRGSLQDVLENDKLVLDWEFKMSLIHDIVTGMRYLHNSDVKSHGSLKSTNCVVDSRFVLKITDFGMHFLRQEPNIGIDTTQTHSYWEEQLWTAPELLRMDPNKRPLKGTQRGDVYSFAIIMHEIVKGQGAFYLKENLSKQQIVEAVRVGGGQLPSDMSYGQLQQLAATLGLPLRPCLDDTLCIEEVANLMRSCWNEEPAERPDFNILKNTIHKLNKGQSGNLLDNLLSRMEQYANNLETLVDERTADYLEEKKKCEKLLYQLLPKSVANQLISGEAVTAENFDQVTIYFSDIVGFTSLSATSSPMEIVDLLNELYTCFDSIIENFNVYKVETIGDAYMVVSGLPIRNGNKHAYEIARMSLALLKGVKSFTIPHRPNEPLRLRIGMHTGPCVAGVVGLKMPRYCLFGDTVNTASRMESTGEPFKIHVSPVTKKVLDGFDRFELECRGEIDVKGKGHMTTYWLLGERNGPTIPGSILEEQLPISKSPMTDIFTAQISPNMENVRLLHRPSSPKPSTASRISMDDGAGAVAAPLRKRDESIPLLSVQFSGKEKDSKVKGT